MSVMSKAEQRFETSEVDLTKLHASSAVVFILHWNTEAEDYLVENIKSLPSEQNIEAKFDSWRKHLEDWKPQDPFDVHSQPQQILVFFNTDPDGDLYRRQMFVTKQLGKIEGLTPKRAFSILRKLKPKKMQNKAQ